ncbi:Hypothetical Protein XCAW_01224 [Xanthomonas citri subsp. citri Aw12879]|nr:Hypothetical Protein XCAW_01224 [Xanthomonas citri subsp. citri Aw12879]
MSDALARKLVALSESRDLKTCAALGGLQAPPKTYTGHQEASLPPPQGKTSVPAMHESA